MFRFLNRFAPTEANTWFLIPALLFMLLMLGSPLLSHGQSTDEVADAPPQPVNLSNTPGRAAHGFTDANETLPDRNHGTGLRVGAMLASAREALRGGRVPALFEGGFFHQYAFGHVGSVQGEMLFFRQRGSTPGARAASGLRLPVLLVINPFYNVSIHLGPQLQWQWNAPTPDDRGRSQHTPARLTPSVVVGGEARVGFTRVGVRYGLPMAALSDLPAAGSRAATDWKAGQVQVYLGAGIEIGAGRR